MTRDQCSFTVTAGAVGWVETVGIMGQVVSDLLQQVLQALILLRAVSFSQKPLFLLYSGGPL